MGAPPKFCFLSQFFFQQSPMGATNCEQVQKQKKSKDKLPMIFLEYIMGANKKKADGRTMGAAPMK